VSIRPLRSGRTPAKVIHSVTADRRHMQQSEACGSNFAAKNDALSWENTRFLNENSELTATEIGPTPAQGFDLAWAT
jgi:hypothetical protein